MRKFSACKLFTYDCLVLNAVGSLFLNNDIVLPGMNNALLTTVLQLLPFVSLIVSNCITAVSFCIASCKQTYYICQLSYYFLQTNVLHLPAFVLLSVNKRIANSQLLYLFLSAFVLQN